jgi:hypothetical protein
MLKVWVDAAIITITKEVRSRIKIMCKQSQCATLIHECPHHRAGDCMLVV